MPAVTMTVRHYSFPVVTGIDANDPAAVRKARMAVYTRLLAELDANHQKLSDQISEIDLSDPEDARVLMPEQGANILAHFGEDRFLERYQRYKAHIAEWRQQYPKLSAVDLRYDQQVVLELAPGAGPAAAAADHAIAANKGEGEKASGDKAEKKKSDLAGTPNQAGLNQAETSPALMVSAAPGQSASEKPGAVKAASGKAVQARPAAAATAKPVKAAASPGGKISAKPSLEKTRKAAREKAAKLKARQKKRATEAKPAALNANRRKSAPPTHSVAVAAEGE
jgi:cell division protein FtsQ